MLGIETFGKGISILESCYKTFRLSDTERPVWYEIIKSVIEEDAFLPLVFNYCKTESAPTCPADLIQFGRKILVRNLPEPAIVANLAWEALTSMIYDDSFDYIHESSSAQVEYLTDHIISMNYIGNQLYCKAVKTVITKFLDVLINNKFERDAARKSILSSEFKAAYKETIQDLSSRIVFTAHLLKASTPLLLEC